MRLQHFLRMSACMTVLSCSEAAPMHVWHCLDCIKPWTAQMYSSICSATCSGKSNPPSFSARIYSFLCFPTSGCCMIVQSELHPPVMDSLAIMQRANSHAQTTSQSGSCCGGWKTLFSADLPGSQAEGVFTLSRIAHWLGLPNIFCHQPSAILNEMFDT